MSCFWGHDWTKWEEIVVKLVNGTSADAQKRVCKICGYQEREIMWS